MASSYFTLPSFARAKKNTEDLRKTNPQEPVLNDEDEKFLEQQISKDEARPDDAVKDAPATQITDDGQEKQVSSEDAGGEVVVPQTQPPANVGTATGNDDPASSLTEQKEQDVDGAAEEPASALTEQEGQIAGSTEEAPYDDNLKEKAAKAKEARKAKKDRGFDLPSQEEAEAATRGFSAQLDQQDKSQGEKRTWASYLPSVRPGSRKGGESTNTQQQDQTSSTETKTGEEGSTEAQGESQADQQPSRTWTEYATSYVPSSWTYKTSKKPDPDAQAEPVYNEDGTINEAATQERQEREVSVLLDNLSLSSINNRVFPLTQETQKYYERFAQCLKDIINGAPTAYDDMDKLMKEAGPKLEKQFQSMPPFVQTLVKSLPAKIGGTLGPEILATASEKPGNDMKARMEAASRPGTADSGINIPAAAGESSETKEGDEKKKSKRSVPGMKNLVGEKSAVAGMLRSAVNFLQTRFPFLASTTNVVMSLAVFSK